MIKAGLVTKEEADERIEFISEAEASVHYTMAYTECNTWLKESSMFAIIDAGGSTVDSTLYECTSQQPLRLEEVCPSQCVQVHIPFSKRRKDLMPSLILNNYRQGEFSLTVPLGVYWRIN
jgi:hypothetical protein